MFALRGQFSFFLFFFLLYYYCSFYGWMTQQLCPCGSVCPDTVRRSPWVNQNGSQRSRQRLSGGRQTRGVTQGEKQAEAIIGAPRGDVSQPHKRLPKDYTACLSTHMHMYSLMHTHTHACTHTHTQLVSLKRIDPDKHVFSLLTLQKSANKWKWGLD